MLSSTTAACSYTKSFNSHKHSHRIFLLLSKTINKTKMNKTLRNL